MGTREVHQTERLRELEMLHSVLWLLLFDLDGLDLMLEGSVYLNNDVLMQKWLFKVRNSIL